MSAERWEQIKRIFDGALAVSASDRDAYVAQACGADDKLRKTVAELLSNHFAAAGFLDENSTRINASPPTFHEGQRVAERFRITRLIARGGMGEVYEGYDERLRLRVALKTIRTDFAADGDAYERFKREVWVTREVSHESICRVFDLIEHRISASGDTPEEVVPCITMKLLDGEDLQTFLARRRPLRPDEALPLIRQIATALQVLHDHDIVHRDLKPSNIMLVTEDNGAVRAVVTDFGLAKPMCAAAVSFETQTSLPAGAPFFIAPELLRGEGPSIASDIYALGLLIDEMVTSSRAFAADSVYGLYSQKLWGEPAPPSARASGLPPAWEHVILRCLDSEPEHRYSRALDVLADLESALPVPGVEHVFAPRIPLRTKFPDLHIGHLNRRAVLIGCLAVPLGIGLLGVIPPQQPDASVLVMPLTNLTGLAEYEVLCKGTTSELIRRLSQVTGLQVFRADSAPAGPAERSTARFGLDGHLRGRKGRLRLAVQLTDHTNGSVLSAQTFEPDIGDSLALESEIAQRTVEVVQLRMRGWSRDSKLASVSKALPEAPRRWLGLAPPVLPRAATTNSAAFNAYIEGRYLADQRTQESALAARQSFHRALAADPQFALAFAGLVDAQIVLMNYNHAPLNQLLQEAKAWAERAVTIDPELPEAHAAVATVLQMMWDWEGAEREFRQALDLHPRFARVRRWYAGMILQFGRFDEALREARLALEHDPFDYPNQAGYGLCLFYAGRPKEAATYLEQMLERREYLYGRAILGQVYAVLGGTAPQPQADLYMDKALQQSVTLRRLEAAGSSGSSYKYSDLVAALAYSYRGRKAEGLPHLQNLEQAMKIGKVPAATVARVYAVLGESARAMDLLESSENTRDRDLLYLKVSPFYRSLRGSDRYDALLRRMRM